MSQPRIGVEYNWSLEKNTMQRKDPTKPLQETGQLQIERALRKGNIYEQKRFWCSRKNKHFKVFGDHQWFSKQGNTKLERCTTCAKPQKDGWKKQNLHFITPDMPNLGNMKVQNFRNSLEGKKHSKFRKGTILVETSCWHPHFNNVYSSNVRRLDTENVEMSLTSQRTVHLPNVENFFYNLLQSEIPESSTIFIN